MSSDILVLLLFKILSSDNLFFIISALKFKSGFCISTTSPPENLDLILSWILLSLLGGLSAVKTIFEPLSNNALNVWKNSSCKASFPFINWISSINNTSVFLK